MFEYGLAHAFEDDGFVLVLVRQVVFRAFDVSSHLRWYGKDRVIEIQVKERLNLFLHCFNWAGEVLCDVR